MALAERAQLIASLDLVDNLSPGLNKAESSLIRMNGAITQTQTKAGGLSGTFKGLAAGFAGGAGFALVSQGLEQVTETIGASIKAASNLNESLSKSGVVFGQSAGEIERWGTTAAKSLGLSEQAAVEAAASFGNLFTGMGLSQGAAAGMSEGIVKLASDLASFNNIGTDEALQKLRSGLVGEAEPLRSVGVLLNEATVNAKAAELGFIRINGVFTEAQKVQARYALILEQTKTAQGDFARTSDGLANSQRIANAALEDALATIGQKLLPLAAKGAQAIADFADAFAKAAPAIEATAGIIGKAFEDVLAPLARTEDALRAVGLAAPLTSDKAVELGKAIRIVQGEQARLTSEFDKGNIGITEYRDKMAQAADKIDEYTQQQRIAETQTAAAADTIDHLSTAQAYATAQAEAHTAALGTNAGKMSDLYATTVGLSGVMGGLQTNTEGVTTASNDLTTALDPLTIAWTNYATAVGSVATAYYLEAFQAAAAARNVNALSLAQSEANKADIDRLRLTGEVPGSLLSGSLTHGFTTVIPGLQNPPTPELPTAPPPPTKPPPRPTPVPTGTDTAVDKITSAYERAKKASDHLFDSLHDRHIKAIKDAENLAEKQHDAAVQNINDTLAAQKIANAAPVTAAEKAQSDTEASRQRRNLVESLQAAQQALATNRDQTRALDLQRSLRDATESLQSFDANRAIDRLKGAQALQDQAAENAAKIARDKADADLEAAKTKAAADEKFVNTRDAKRKADFDTALAALKKRDEQDPAKFLTDLKQLQTKFGIFTDERGFTHIGDVVADAIKSTKAPDVKVNLTVPRGAIQLNGRDINNAVTVGISPTQAQSSRSGNARPRT